MNIDSFRMFATLSAKQQDLAKPYLSPEFEASIFKGVPLDRVAEFKEIARILVNGPVRVKYRGSRNGDRYDTPRQLATSVSIYPK